MNKTFIYGAIAVIVVFVLILGVLMLQNPAVLKTALIGTINDNEQYAYKETAGKYQEIYGSTTNLKDPVWATALKGASDAGSKAVKAAGITATNDPDGVLRKQVFNKAYANFFTDTISGADGKVSPFYLPAMGSVEGILAQSIVDRTKEANMIFETLKKSGPPTASGTTAAPAITSGTLPR